MIQFLAFSAGGGGARLSIELDDGSEASPGVSGHVIYQGDNVMLGYAQSRADLSKGDECGGVLRTGDIGFLDTDGYLTLTGRTQRFAKVAGLRIALDDLEALAGEFGPCAAVECNGVVFVAVPRSERRLAEQIETYLRARTSAPLHAIRVVSVDVLPTKANGKTDYRQLIANLTDAAS